MLLEKLQLSGNLKEKELEALALSDSLLMRELELKDKALKLYSEKAKNDRLEKETALHQAEINRQRLINVSLALGTLVALLICFTIWQAFKGQKRANELLKAQKDELTLKNEEIQQQKRRNSGPK
ncbi:MAG: hypothetical protein HC880_06025 [Bacteroidia bacterium]|nr:hypothetical protein [Bacteroidia bacterium]